MASLALCLCAFFAGDSGDSRDAVSVFLVRVEATAWPTALRKPPLRVQRDDEGHIVVLRLDGMKLRADDIEVLRGFAHLERLSLISTTIDDSQLKRLSGLPRLVGINLNRTPISDRGVESLAEFPKLKTVCLGGVRVSRQAVQALKAKRPKMSVGYFPSPN